MHNKHLARLFFILTFLFLSSSAYLLLPDQPKTVIVKPPPQNIIWTDVATNTVISDKTAKTTIPKIISTTTTAVAITTTTKTEQIPVVEEIKNPVNVIMEISDKQYALQLPEKSTAYDAIQKLISDNKISASLKEFKGIGYFVEEINGLKNNNQTGEYWIYYINGQSAKMGISSYTLKNNDLIKWIYEHAKF